MRLLDPQPRCEYRISKVGPGQMLDVDRLSMSPEAAAKHDPNAFLRFAADVARVTLELKAAQSQLKLDL